jgi:hypothetical protein
VHERDARAGCESKRLLNPMTEKEILKRISKIEGIGRMTVNERLYVCELMDEFDKSLIIDKNKAKKILELLSVDKDSIEIIIK